MSDSGPALRPVHRQLRFASVRVVTALILREMSSTYGRSPGGYLWSLVEPVGGILLLAWIFSLGLMKPPLGANFTMFYATGLLPFYVFMNVCSRTTAALGYSRQLLAYPRVTVVDVLLARFLLNLMTQLLISYAILATLRLWYDTGTTLELGSIVLGFGMAAALAAGVGTLNCFLTAMFPLWSNLWSVVMRPLALVSGVMFLVETAPQPFQGYLLWNPLAHVVTEVRTGFYHGYDPAFISPAFVFGISLGTLALGLLFLWRFHRDLLEK